MDTIIRRIRPEEYDLLREFLYQAIYPISRRERNRRHGRWSICRSCRSILPASAHSPAIIALLPRWRAPS